MPFAQTFLKDYFSGFVRLFAIEAANAANAAEALQAWFSEYCAVKVWVSDMGSPFLNELMRILAKRLRVCHQFTPAYASHVNGTVKAVCKKVVRAARALLPDFGLQPKEWTEAVQLIQSLINNTLARQFIDGTPLKVLTKLNSNNLLAVILAENAGIAAGTTLVALKQLPPFRM